MLTQCPECKTAFRLHINQLKAAAGKVQCSRCNTTFDALDNLFEPAPAAEEPPQTPAPARPPEQQATPESLAEEPVGGDTPTEPESKPLIPPPSPDDEKERLTSLFDEPAVEPAATNEDTLSSFIDELEESTTNSDTTTFALETEAPQPQTPGVDAWLDVLGESPEAIDETAPETPFHLPSVGAHPAQGEDVISAALDSIEELFGTEPVKGETPALIEVEETGEAPVETFDDIFSVEPLEEETLPLVEVDDAELKVEPAETFDEELTVELVKEESSPQLEVDSLDISEDKLDAFFEATTAENTEEGAAEFSVSNDELDAFFEEEVPESADERAAESILSHDELDAFFEEEVPLSADERTAESIVSNAELDAFFEEEVPEVVSDEAAELTQAESTTATAFPEQGELLEILEQEPAAEAIEQLLTEPDEESALDEVLLPDEPEPVELATTADPLTPFSGEQAAEEASIQAPPHHAPEVMIEPASAAPAVAESLAEDELVLSKPAAPSGYAIPTELTQARQGSGKGTVLWGLGIVLMCAALVLQYLYYFRLQLVENPQLRPLLTTMCEVTGCALPPRRDLGRIELSEHLMQFHPNYEQSLLITATLANRAEFAQPYPLIEVVMTNIEQQVVARRHFTPQQYIPKLTNDSFPANSEIPLMLEVVDPGNNAVGFEFRFY